MTDSLTRLDALFEEMTEPELATAWARSARTLRKRGAVRTSNIVGDLAEADVARRLRLRRGTFSEKSIDAVGKGRKTYQIKGRWKTPENRSRQVSAIRGPFDYLVVVFFDIDMRAEEIWLIPHSVVETNRKHVERTNSFRFSVTKNVEQHPDVKRLL